MNKYSLASCVISIAMLASTAMAANLTIPGSTTVQKRIIEPAAAAIESATGIKVKAQGTSSGKGFKSLMKGSANVSMSSSPLSSLLNKNKLADDGTYQEHVLARDVIVPIVHPSNPVSELSFQQLADINTGKIRNWKEVGGADQRIIVVTSKKGSATRSVFQKQVMKKASYVKGVREVQSTRQEVDMVSKFKGGIGAVSEAFVAMNPGKSKVIKTKEISRPLILVTEGAPQPDVKKVIDFLQSDKAKKHFK